MFRRRSELPPGYKFSDPSSISPDEAVALFRASEFISESKPDYVSLQEWDEALQDSMVIVAVRDRRRQLVGMGTLVGDTDHADLNHLMVHPEHRHRGLGRTLVKKRVEIAEQLNVQTLDVTISPTNTLGKLYTELGFKALDVRTMRREK